MVRFLFGVLASVLPSVAIFVVALSAPASAREVKAYFYGNSLINHQSETDETTVPHWLALIARAAGHDFSADGQFIFVTKDEKDTPPQPNWRFDQVDRAWGRQYRNFGDVGYDVIVTNPVNFIQYQAPDVAYDGDNPDGLSPLSATLAMFDRVAAEANPGRFVIYEGWADMGPFLWRFPPSDGRLAKYHVYNAGAYHGWYETYVADLRAARPDLTIDLVPVARILSELLSEAPLQSVPVRDLYVDDAPHGTPTLYFLASAVTYVALYNEALPSDLPIPSTVHHVVRDNWATLAAQITSDVGLRETEVVATPAPRTLPGTAPTKPKMAGLGLANPSQGTNLNGIADWSTQLPFVDMMKTARLWIGHQPGKYGAWSAQDLLDGGFLDDEGWPWGIPSTLESVEALILTDLPEDAVSAAGRYRVTWQGSGTVRLTGRARTVSRNDREIFFDFSPGDGPVGIRLTETDPERTGDYVHAISVVKEPHIPLFEAGAVFNPDWIARIEDMRLLRFMDWMQTNNSTLSAWQDRPQVSDFSFGWRGVPVEIMMELANQVGADPWVTLPHKADDEFVRNFAELARDLLDPGLKIHVEYSNEVWNFVFQQTHWAREQAEARWGDAAPSDAWMQFAGMRAAQVMDIWTDVFGAEADDRILRVLGVHSGWPGLEQVMLEAPLFVAEGGGNTAPVEAFDAYAVTGYFGHSLGTDEGAPMVLGWILEARKRAEVEGKAKGLTRVALADYIRSVLLQYASEPAVEHLRQGELADLLTKTLPYHAKVAAEAGLELIMYEGGTHVTGVGSWVDDTLLTDFFTTLNYGDGMGDLYGELLAGWQASGGTVFTHFLDVAKPTKFGSWGAMRHLDDENPRHMALKDFNTTTPAWWETRDSAAFLHGAVFTGTEGPERLDGTAKRDILLGSGGDDVLVARGRGDLMHGGTGQDIALLPGMRADYAFATDGGQITATSVTSTHRLFSIELVAFSDDRERVISIGELF